MNVILMTELVRLFVSQRNKPGGTAAAGAASTTSGTGGAKSSTATTSNQVWPRVCQWRRASAYYDAATERCVGNDRMRAIGPHSWRWCSATCSRRWRTLLWRRTCRPRSSKRCAAVHSCADALVVTPAKTLATSAAKGLTCPLPCLRSCATCFSVAGTIDGGRYHARRRGSPGPVCQDGLAATTAGHFAAARESASIDWPARRCAARSLARCLYLCAAAVAGRGCVCVQGAAAPPASVKGTVAADTRTDGASSGTRARSATCTAKASGS